MKKSLSILLVLVLTAALVAGCNGDQPPASPPPPPVSQSPSTQPSPDDDDPGTEPGTEPDTDPNGDEPVQNEPAGPIMISAQELAAIFDDANTIAIGAINPTSALVPFSNASNPLRGSYLVWVDDYFGANPEALSSGLANLRPPLADLESLLSRAGITENSQIVVYASDFLSQGAYFAWQLSMLGLNVRFLDGGVAAWRDNRGATGRSSRLSSENVQNDFKAPNYNPAGFDATIDVVIEAAQNPDEWVIIDTRDSGEYNGETKSSGAYGSGRIKGAVHIDWRRVLNPEDVASGQLRSRDELMDLYGFIGDRKVIVYCQGGVRSAYTWIVLKDLGFDVINYDGSWVEWSYAASTASDYPSDVVLSLTEEWADNGGVI